MFQRRYMVKGNNILWEIHAQPETDDAFHRGANVSKLSQVQIPKKANSRGKTTKLSRVSVYVCRVYVYVYVCVKV